MFPACENPSLIDIEPKQRQGNWEQQHMMTSTSSAAETLVTIAAFNDAFNRHDIAAVMALMTDDVVFENTSPFPEGERYEGQTAVSGFWERLFTSTPDAHFDAEDIFAADDRCTVRWRYAFTSSEGIPDHVRGVDVFRVRDGKVAEKLCYVKG